MNKPELKYTDISLPLRGWLESHGFSEKDLISLAGSAGSNRVYYRMVSSEKSIILLVSPIEEVDFHKFLRITQYYRLLNFPVPQVHCIDDVAYQVLLEDLGAETLCTRYHTKGVRIQNAYGRTLEILLDLQSRVTSKSSECPDIASRVFGLKDLLWESGYFKTYYLDSYKKASIPEASLKMLNAEFLKLAESVSRHPLTIMHRDFQSQNIMLHNNNVRIIDYQGSRLGSEYYDVASLLLDPYTNMPEESVIKYFNDYHSGSGSSLSNDESLHCFLNAGTQRLLQALGAYCNLSYHKGMSQFEQHIVPAVEKLTWVMNYSGRSNLFDLLKPYLEPHLDPK